ncbi:MAG: hypothetical protein GEU88_01965 [Solirubrobacterales bacterium]|nr:hypothetical protein [Solirubrobacterales bacterium]
MRVFFVADRAARERPPESFRGAGLELEPIVAPLGLADALVALEPRLAAAGDIAVVLGDDSDLSLATALVAAKLQLPLAATAAALDPASRNGRLLAQLADATLGDDPSAIAAWAGAATGDASIRPG